jgi:hypothetical protein
MRTFGVIDGRTAFSAYLLAVGRVWFWFFNAWLRHRPSLLEQRAQDLVGIASCGCLLFVLAALLLAVLPKLSGWLVGIPLGVWLAFVTVYLARREW